LRWQEKESYRKKKMQKLNSATTCQSARIFVALLRRRKVTPLFLGEGNLAHAMRPCDWSQMAPGQFPSHRCSRTTQRWLEYPQSGVAERWCWGLTRPPFIRLLITCTYGATLSFSSAAPPRAKSTPTFTGESVNTPCTADTYRPTPLAQSPAHRREPAGPARATPTRSAVGWPT
jgi:hypothetical protein